MSQEKFDDLLRQSFDKDRDIPFDESAWQSLAGRLPDDKKYFLPLWALILLGSGWILAALALLWPETGHHPIAASTSVSQSDRSAQIAVPGPAFVADTVYIPKIVEKTVVKYRYQTISRPANSPLTSALPVAETNNLTNNKLESIDRSIKTNSPEQQEASEPPRAKTTYTELPDRLLSPIPLLERASNTTLLVQPNVSPINKSKHARSRFQIGLTAGWARVNYNSLQTSLSSLDQAFSVNDNLAENEDIEANSSEIANLAPLGIRQYGLQASYRISRFFSIQAGIGQENISYQNERPFEGKFDASLRANQAYSNADVLLTQTGMYYELGAQYRMESRFSPIAQTALRMRSHLLRSTNLEEGQTTVDVPNTNQYVSAESINSISRRKSFHIEQLRLGAGLAYRISPAWEVQSTADFYAPLRYDGWLQPGWGLNFALKYSL